MEVRKGGSGPAARIHPTVAREILWDGIKSRRHIGTLRLDGQPPDVDAPWAKSVSPGVARFGNPPPLLSVLCAGRGTPPAGETALSRGPLRLKRQRCWGKDTGGRWVGELFKQLNKITSYSSILMLLLLMFFYADASALAAAVFATFCLVDVAIFVAAAVATVFAAAMFAIRCC